MSDTNTNSNPAAQPPTSAAQPPAATPPAEPQTLAQPPAGAPADGPKKVRLGGDSDEIPEDGELFELSPKALSARLARHSRKELKSLFGTDNVDEIKKEMEELKTLRDEREKARQEKLSADERAKEEIAKLRAEKDAAEARSERVQMRAAYKEGKSIVTGVLSTLVDPEFHDALTPKIQRYILKNPEEFKTIRSGKTALRSFIKDYLADHPKRALGHQSEPERRPLSNGARAEPPTGSPAPAQKSVKEMNRQEYKQFMASKGITV
jgi:hypothetical protein